MSIFYYTLVYGKFEKCLSFIKIKQARLFMPYI